MINPYNACAYNTSVMLRKIYCTYFYIFTIFTYTKCANAAARKGVRGNAGREQRSSSIRLANHDLSKWPERIRPNPSPPTLLSPPVEKNLLHGHFYGHPVVRDTCRHFRHSSAINARDTRKKKKFSESEIG